MANGTLSFQLPEEQPEFDLACKAGDLLFVLNELTDSLRSHLRHSTDPDWDTTTVAKLYELLNQMRTERCLHFD
jgi:hypothetical protein